ncbi:hypothetical protein O5D80_002240 [Batrachochytrium dendrobatidis]|nr:hypothetical protein O5D80_002240 [Batrachochytrium dendrobatidis]
MKRSVMATTSINVHADNQDMHNQIETTDEQANLLRHNYLRLWAGLISTHPQPVDITLKDGQTLPAIFRATNSSQSLINVSQLKTPLGTYPDAQIRMQDVCILGFDVYLPDSLSSKTCTSEQINETIE